MRRTLQILALLAVPFLAAGCAGLDVLGPEQSAALVNKVQVGMSEAEVLGQLGRPQKQEVHGTTTFLFYETIWQVAEQAKQRSPIAIKDGMVVGLGNAYLQSFTSSAVSGGSWTAEVNSERRISN